MTSRRDRGEQFGQPVPAGRADHRIAARLLAGAVVFAVAALAWLRAAHPIVNGDFGWHVAMGRFVLEHGVVPLTEPFTHTAAGAPMVAQQWLSQWSYAAFIDAFGVGGLRLGNAFLAAGSVGLLFAWLRREGAGVAVSLLGTVLWLVIAQSRFQHRPHMFNLLLFLVAYGALFVVRPRLRAWQLAGFFALTVLWINLHSGAVLFVALTGAYALAATFEQRVLGQPPVASEPGAGSLPRLWALFGTLCLAILVSPNGARVLPYVLESGAVNRGLSLEWFGMASAHAFRVHDALSLVCFYGLTVLAAISLGFSPDRVPIARRVVVLAVALLPFLSQRFTWTSFVLVVFVFGSVGSVWLARERIARVAIPACTVLVLILTGVGLTRDLRPETIRERVHPSANFRPGTFPVVAMTFLEEVDLAGNLFNENRWGGYVLFRTQEQYPIFADGRWVTIGVPVVLASREISHRKPGYGELLDRYGIEILLVHRGFATPEVIREQALLPVFENFNAGVYLRPGAAFEENRRRVAAWYEARRIPFDSQTGFDEEQAVAADPRWAKRMHIRRVHVEAFGVDGERARGAKPVKVSGW